MKNLRPLLSVNLALAVSEPVSKVPYDIIKVAKSKILPGRLPTGFVYPPVFHAPPSVGGLDLDSRSSGYARLGGGVGPPLWVVVEEVAVLVVLVRRFLPGRYF